MPSDSDGFDVPPAGATGGPPADAESAELSYGGDDPPSPVDEALAAREAELFAIDGVMGVGIGDDDVGNDTIIVYVADRGVAERLPSDVDGFAVHAVVTGEIDAY